MTDDDADSRIRTTWRDHVLETLNRVGLTVVQAVELTPVSESTLRNWVDPDWTGLPDLRMVSRFAMALSQPLRPALAAAGLPPEELGIEEGPPKTAQELLLELQDIANELARMASDPQNPSPTRGKGVTRFLLGSNPGFSPRGDVSPL